MNWTYSEPRMAVLDVIGNEIARLYDEASNTPFQEAWQRTHQDGYLMASAPNLRDELTNLSRAVRDLLLVSNDPIASAEEAQHCWDTVENMCERAERALATLFPPEPTA